MSADFTTPGSRPLKRFGASPVGAPVADTQESSVIAGVPAGSAMDRMIRESMGASAGDAVPATGGVPVADVAPDYTAPVADPAPAMSGTATFPDVSADVTDNVDTADSGDGIVGQQFVGSAQNNPCFTVIGIDDEDIAPFSREYTEQLDITNCVAEIPMLLDYMVRLERAFGVTLPFAACGIDTIVFDQSCTQQPTGTVTIQVDVRNIAGKSESGAEDSREDIAFYEKITVDGVIYLSCINQSLNPDYLHRVIMEAVDAIYMHKQYVYTLVGPRPLSGRTVDVEFESDEEGDGPIVEQRQEFIQTLKLNSYELSVFINYMQSIEGVNISHGTYDGRQAILFRR